MVNGSVLGQAGDDTITLQDDADVSDNVDGGIGDDTITLDGGTVVGNVFGGDPRMRSP